MEVDKLYLGDCLDVMKGIPKNSIDMVLCDLPYGVLNKKNKSAKWDVIIPFEPLWNEYLRVCKKNAAIVLFSSGMFTSKLMMSRPDLWRYNLVWDKGTTTGFLNANRMPLRQHEDICVFYRKLPTYHPQMTTGKVHSRQHGNLKNSCYGDYGMQPDDIKTNEYYPTSIIKTSKEVNRNGGFHPTAKPLEILQYLIRTYSDKGNTILDNTMGSGSTCVAAIREQRHFIGIEKEEQYYNIAVNRVNQELQSIKNANEIKQNNFERNKDDYKRYNLSMSNVIVQIAIRKSPDGEWLVSAEVKNKGWTAEHKLNETDVNALFKDKTATRSQLAAKYLNSDIESLSMSKSAERIQNLKR